MSINITEIKTKDCVPFDANPFAVRDNGEMELLKESIRQNGVLHPITVRPTGDGRYEIISGHRRVHAARALGLETIPALVKEMTYDKAVIYLVDSNFHRDGLLPSEKAFALRMRLDAMKHQGRTSDQLGQKLTSVEELGHLSGESKTQIQRYIRLTHLNPLLLGLVDEGRIALTTAVELSYLTEEEQDDLYETIDSEDCTPSLSQAARMRKLSANGELDMDTIFDIMTEQKPNQREFLKVPLDEVSRYFTPGTRRETMENCLLKAFEYYIQSLSRQKKRDGGER